MVTVIYITTTTFFYPLNGLCVLWDWPSRLRQNDTTLQFHHFFWTTFTYLGPFFLLQTWIVTLTLTPRLKPLLFLVLIFYLVELQDYLFGNLIYGEGAINYWNFNLLLTNNLNKYHPHLFYCSTWILFYLLISQYPSIKLSNILYTNTSISREAYDLIYTTGLINSLALFLGSWWAFQEGTWGGWWNWDPSEVLGLLVLLTPLLLLHKTYNYLRVNSLSQKTLLGVLLFIWVYFFTQLNFDLVSHNFGNRFAFFFVNTLFYLDMLLLLTVGLFYLWYLRVGVTKSLKLSRQLLIRYDRARLRSIILPLLWFVLVFCSFQPLFNYFLWQYFSMNLLNFSGNCNLIYYLTTFTLWGIFTKIRYITPFTLYGVLVYGSSAFITIFTPPLRKAVSAWELLHTFISLTLILNLLDNQTLVTLVSYKSFFIHSITHNLNFSLNFEVWVVEDYWKEVTYIFTSTKSYNTVHSFITTHANCEVNKFLFLQNSTTFTASILTTFSNNLLTRSYLHTFFSSFYEVIIWFSLVIASRRVRLL